MTNLHVGPIARSLVRTKARSVLTVSMTVLTLAIVVNCIELIRGTQSKLAIRSGVDDAHLVYIEIDNFDQTLVEPGDVRARIRADLALLRATPGVVQAMNTRFMPWRGGGSSSTMSAYGTDQEPVRTQHYTAGPSLATALGVDIVGTPLTVAEMDDDNAGDSASNAAGVIVTRALADALFPDREPTGQLIAWGDNVVRIDGVIEHLYNPYAWNIEELVTFYPGYTGGKDGSSFLVRVDDRRLGALAELEHALLAANSHRGIKLSTIPERREQYDATNTLAIKVFGLVIVLMVLVAGVSMVGLTAASVATRRRQIGTRRALGATRGDVLRGLLLENALLTGVGLALGLGGAYGLNVLLVTQVGAPRLAFPWVAAAMLLIAVINGVAALQPALRASRIPPALATKAH